jgi:hypothetical protein
MLGLFKKSTARRKPVPTCQLNLERLDDRIAPAAPVIDSFNVVQLEGNTYKLYGHVTDESPLGLVVYFGGEVQAAQRLDATCDAYGNYFVIFTRSSSADCGEITADCTDWWGETADRETVVLA